MHAGAESLRAPRACLLLSALTRRLLTGHVGLPGALATLIWALGGLLTATWALAVWIIGRNVRRLALLRIAWIRIILHLVSFRRHCLLAITSALDLSVARDSKYPDRKRIFRGGSLTLLSSRRSQPLALP